MRASAGVAVCVVALATPPVLVSTSRAFRTVSEPPAVESVRLGEGAAHSPPRQGSQSLSPDLAARIDRFVARWSALRTAPGVAVGVVREGYAVYLRGFGVESLDRPDDPVTPESLFHVASNSKPFVSTVILGLAVDGLVDLDAPIASMLPYLQLDDPRVGAVTVRQMLSHVSGLPEVENWSWGDSEDVDDGALERYVRSLRQRRLVADPGGEFHYSNLAFEVLGDLIAKVTGGTFEQAMRDRLLEPLQMHRSSFLLADVDPGLLTDPHDRILAPFVSHVRPYNRMHAPSSTLYSSARDMSNWLRMQLSGGSWQGRAMLPAELHRQTFEPVARTGWGGYDDHVGTTWYVGEYRGERVASHKGRDLGYGSMVMLMPSKSLGVVVLGNAHFAPIAQITEGVVDMILGHEPPSPRASARYRIGEVIVADGVEAGLEAYQRLLESDSGGYEIGAEVLVQLGEEAAEQLGGSEAIEIARFAVDQHRDSVAARRALAEAYLRLALATFRETLEIDPADPVATEVLRRLGQSGD